ncbi:hypothetical protein GQ600_2877 [Phytophthora cactorum]|nr:hypothetical protein GQ600_2877 [Phytophthora cactorum]
MQGSFQEEDMLYTEALATPDSDRIFAQNRHDSRHSLPNLTTTVHSALLPLGHLVGQFKMRPAALQTLPWTRARACKFYQRTYLLADAIEWIINTIRDPLVGRFCG